MAQVRQIAAGLIWTVAPLAAAEAVPLNPYQPPVNATQTIRIWGDRHMDALTRAWARAYRVAHPEISFEIKLLGNGTGMPALYLGLADLAFFGRDLIVTDKDGFNHVMKYDPVRIELGTGSLDAPGKATALALFVHRDNPLAQLTLAQVDAIFSAQRRRGAPAAIRTWGQLGLTGEWADKPINLYADDTQSMAALFFQRVALGDSRMMNWEHFTEFQDIRHPDGTVTEAAAQSMAALRADRYGLAVSNLHYLDAQVRPVALAAQEGGAYGLPTAENLISRRYPLTRTIFACANQAPGRPLDPKVRDFLHFILGPEGQQVLAQDGQYLPLMAATARQELAKLP
ncbi:substrate-binding domain-containing protein [Opitutus sp. GAS368]|uniref:PstS family phosphate ABC transporter substrate-binding protein n=1 Tax=Opitutus sp. GAS368 TaxID=1882749 RepID=UPI0012FE0965|nr:substrate-binding domain-containing protein [Opitutus sp. GAS368]